MNRGNRRRRTSDAHEKGPTGRKVAIFVRHRYTSIYDSTRVVLNAGNVNCRCVLLDTPGVSQPVRGEWGVAPFHTVSQTRDVYT